MSGSGGVLPVWGAFVGELTNCDDLRFETNLASPVEEVVERLVGGAELVVSLEEGVVQPVVVARLEDDEVGSIVERLRDLIRCLQMGRSFVAIVRTVDDGIVRVEVMPA